jgi:indolepyruvate ferredoxin oxidoreductase
MPGHALRAVSLDDRYALERGTVFLSGTQALVRLPLEQRRRDARAGLSTAGFVSGYRGSPLGGYDLALWQAKAALTAAHVRFEPGLNEELAATSVWGTQQTEVFGGSRYDGVFGIWYAKNPGVDRAGDALKHANAAGTARHGGVLAISGDDPGASSSTLPNQCEPAFIAAAMPVLHPADVGELLEFGLFGFALSRFSGLWVGFKTVADTVESTATVELPDERAFVTPPDFALPPGGLYARWPDDRWSQDERLHRYRLPAAIAFARANGIDRTERSGRDVRLGIVAAGKSYLDVREALRLLGIDERGAGELGLALYKPGLVWPLEPAGLRAFAEGVDELLVIEERQPVIEAEAKRLAYNWPADRRPVIVGKQDERGAPLVPATGELSPLAVARLIAERLGDPRIEERLQALPGPAKTAAPAVVRVPHFCAGCPHNRSTAVPEGSVAMAGIGCHSLAIWKPGSRTMTLTHMGGEGANWIGLAPFVETPHMFQNMGDGTYHHSGLLAIRAALAAGTPVTFKILVNDAAAMTGGQPVEGSPTAEAIARQLVAEGVARVALVGEARPAVKEPGVTVHHRDELDAVQRELRAFRGVSAIVYDQVCATEKRRRRRRGELPAPTIRPFINSLVCEGCGDCVAQSGCVAVQPLETPFGRKRRIDAAACNVDLSCLEGFCPSFVTVEGGTVRRREVPLPETFERLPEPAIAALDAPVNVLVAGVGGSGVITVGALLGMAAHLEGNGALVLDNTGLARKGGAVATHVRIARDAGDLHAPRIGAAQADVLIACDLIVAASPATIGASARGRTQIVANTHPTLTAAQLADPDAQCDFGELEAALVAAAGEARVITLDATTLASALLGDSIYANLLLLGAACQRGWLPVGGAALERAIELNGNAVAENLAAFRWGRLAAANPEAVRNAAAPYLSEAVVEATLDQIVDRRARFLAEYQNEAYAARYRALVDLAREAERTRCGTEGAFAEAVARSYFKLLAYKDEYEVARLHGLREFRAALEREFEGDFRVAYHFAPPLLPGRPRKRRFGPWVRPVLAGLARLRRLRGTALDPFGWTAERRRERALIGEYETTIRDLALRLSPQNRAAAVELAALPQCIRGFGHVKWKALEEAGTRSTALHASLRRVT